MPPAAAVTTPPPIRRPKRRPPRKKAAAKKKPKDLPLGDEPFLETWSGRTLSEMVTLIALTMPNDGSAVVSDAEALDLVAYIIQQNGYPAGSKPLTKETAAAVIERPRK